VREFQIESVLRDTELAAELTAALNGARLPGDGGPAVGAEAATVAGSDAVPRARRSGTAAATGTATTTPELVLDLGDGERFGWTSGLARPVLAVGAGTFEAPRSRVWQARLLPTRRRLARSAASVGQVGVEGSLDPLGTAWLVAPGLAATSPTVVAVVAVVRHTGRAVTLSFPPGPLGSESPQADVVDVEAVPGPDPLGLVGLLRLEPRRHAALPPPLALLDAAPEDVSPVVVAWCGRVDAGVTGDGSIGTGRAVRNWLAPGGWTAAGHDASVGPGGDGSPLLEVATGAVVGVHLADGRGRPHPVLPTRAVLAALAKAAPEVAPVLQLRTSPDADRGVARGGDLDVLARGVPADHLLGRTGYQEGFLGPGERRVPLPTVPAGLARQLVVVDDAAKGTERFALAYEHYSSVMHAGRRMPLFTATNIDGSQAQAIKRTRDNWSLDPRIPAASQWGAELYSGNDLDRGHLTRRLDPAWGSTATQGEADTFFYTNACPQQHRFNDGIWGDLEDYLLENAATLHFRACVFTGPVFAEDDQPYRGALIPARYWKVAVMVQAERGELSATGYLLSQADLLPTRDFVFGQFRTYQVPLRQLEQLTGVRWTALRRYDPLDSGKAGATRAVPHLLERPDDVVL
jgi:endonuclease G